MKSFSLFFYYLFVIFGIIDLCLADILIIKKGSNRTIEVIGDLAAAFGPALPKGGLQVIVK